MSTQGWLLKNRTAVRTNQLLQGCVRAPTGLSDSPWAPQSTMRCAEHHVLRSTGVPTRGHLVPLPQSGGTDVAHARRHTHRNTAHRQRACGGGGGTSGGRREQLLQGLLLLLCGSSQRLSQLLLWHHVEHLEGEQELVLGCADKGIAQEVGKAPNSVFLGV